MQNTFRSCRRWHDGTRPAHMPIRILAVDHHASTRQRLATTLSLEGYFVAIADSGSSALNSAFAFEPDLVVVDATLPDMPGIELLRTLRATGFYKPAIALTCLVFDCGAQVFQDAGFDAMCTKPTGTEHLLVLIRELTAG